MWQGRILVRFETGMGERRVSSAMFDIRKHHHESDLSGCIASEKVIRASKLTMSCPLLQPTHPNLKEVACKAAINVTTFKNSTGSD